VPKVSPEHLEARRAEILAGARRAFARYGYDGATVVRLEEETGLSRGAIFHYFGGKQALFIALAVEMNRRYVDLLMEQGLDETMRAMAAENPDWLGVMIEVESRLRHHPEFVRAFEEAFTDRDRLAQWFAERQADNTFRDDVDVVHLGRFVTMLLNGLALRVVVGDETDIDQTLRLLHDALGPRH
jgi:AcrR family transcriptional regulator